VGGVFKLHAMPLVDVEGPLLGRLLRVATQCATAMNCFYRGGRAPLCLFWTPCCLVYSPRLVHQLALAM